MHLRSGGIATSSQPVAPECASVRRLRRPPVVFGQVVVGVEEGVAVPPQAPDEPLGACAQRLVGQLPRACPEGGDEHALLADVVDHQLKRRREAGSAGVTGSA